MQKTMLLKCEGQPPSPIVLRGRCMRHSSLVPVDHRPLPVRTVALLGRTEEARVALADPAMPPTDTRRSDHCHHPLEFGRPDWARPYPPLSTANLPCALPYQ